MGMMSPYSIAVFSEVRHPKTFGICVLHTKSAIFANFWNLLEFEFPIWAFLRTKSSFCAQKMQAKKYSKSRGCLTSLKTAI